MIALMIDTYYFLIVVTFKKTDLVWHHKNSNAFLINITAHINSLVINPIKFFFRASKWICIKFDEIRM